MKTSTPTDSGGGSEQWVVMSGDLTGVQICNQVAGIDTKMKSSTWRQREVLNLEAEKSSTVTLVEASRY